MESNSFKLRTVGLIYQPEELEGILGNVFGKTTSDAVLPQQPTRKQLLLTAAHLIYF